ncbi:MAG TPA: hypothetical protein VMN76_09045 [Acidobacteriota bacterium]|nr:hypothetical protein [Acidobacteriota bacterium]
MKNLLKVAAIGCFLTAAAATAENQEVPEAPFQLEASAEFEGASAIAALRWRDQSESELGFEILRSDNQGEFRVVGIVGANTTEYRDKVGRYVTGAFTYKVRAFNEVGKSEDSNLVSVWF